jgi:outer membrane protein TolC
MKTISVLILMIFTSIATAQELDDYLQIAAKNNPGTKAAYAEFEAAMQKAPQAKGLPDPTLTMSAFGYMEEASFSLMQMFPWFGTLGAKEKASILAAEANYQKFLDQRNKLFYQVSEQYYQLYALEKSIRFQEENLKILKDYKELALAEVESGSGALADVLRTEIRMDETRTALNILNLQRNPIATKFNVLLNRDENAEINVPDTLRVKPEKIKPKPDSIFKAHPRVLQMEKMLAASEVNEKVARKNGLPKFGLGVNYMIIEEGMMMRPSGRDVVMPMLSVSLPIFRGKYKAARKEAEFMQESYRQRIIETENTLSSEYAEAIFAMEKAREMLELYKKQVKSTQQVLDLSLSGYQNATIGFEEVLRIRQELLQYQLAMAKAESNYLTAKAKLNYITKNTSNHEIKNEK